MDEHQRVMVAGQPCARMTSDHLVVDVAVEVGPRILGLRLLDGDNMFAELPEMQLEHDGRTCHLYGGHRVWDAPERPATSWLPDDGPVELITESLSISVRGALRPDGLSKLIRVSLDAASPSATVQHQLRNDGNASVTVAPWAVSMLRPGGIAVLPFDRIATDAAGLQASTSRLVLWPYTDLTDPALQWSKHGLMVNTSKSAAGTDAKNKIGGATTTGWCAYATGGEVLVKLAAPCSSTVDSGATQQVFWEAQFVELETLGPLTTLEPGQHVEHVEQWRIARVPVSQDPVEFAALLATGPTSDPSR